NSVTVSGEPSVVEDIARLINDSWDLPRPETTKKVYHLTYTDPIKMRDMLHELLGEQAGGGIGRRGRGPGTTAGQRADVAEAIGGIYQIQAYPDSNSLVVICKTEESFKFLDSLIEDLDQPVFPGVPVVIELKHADAEEVADQINAIFAPAGARVDIRRRDTGLEGIEIQGRGESGDAGTGGREGTTGEVMTFPWQQGRQAEDETPESPLIGKVRVVPIHRQNAVMILAAAEYRDTVRDIIVNDLDKPGRQVMISAIIAEVELTDELSLGLRWSDLGLPRSNVDNRISADIDFLGSVSIFGGIFDTSMLDVGTNINMVLQALSQKTKIRILQEPAVFTADNQEASFFEGQDVPVLQSSLTSTEGASITESVSYEAVGIGLNVRPRITTQGDVDMEVNLEISNIDVAASTGAVSPVFDRRETTTQVIVKDGQTIVISGILRHLESKIKRKVPLLGDIPIIGLAFTSVENETTSTELLAFVTPYVVNTPEENDANFNQRARERLEDLSKPLKEQDVQEPQPEKMRRRLLQPEIDKGRRPQSDLDEIIEG
ncbi:MAG: type II secretion system protein GspD, partial [Planctomycetota bacterium]